MRILYVEDEIALAEAVVHLLKKAGIAVDHASDGLSGLNLAEKNIYDCIVLDIMLPEMSGLEILAHLRRTNCKTPIIMLSALSEVDDKIKALNIGADDYLAKPFKTAELIARIKALMRRPPTLAPAVLIFADLEFDPENHTLNIVSPANTKAHELASFPTDANPLALTSKEAAILELLLKNPDKIHAKSTIMNYAWGDNATPTENYVEVYISFLRTKLKTLKSRAKIKTMRNLGYKIVDEK